MTPHMHKVHLDMIRRLLGKFPARPMVFEWGCGGSTAELAGCSAVWVAAELDPEWAAKVQAATASLPVAIKVFDYGVRKTSDAQFQDEMKRIPCTQYINAPFAFAPFDVYLVDGRHRAECVAVARSIGLRPFIVLHDAERPEYRAACEGTEVVVSSTVDGTELRIMRP